MQTSKQTWSQEQTHPELAQQEGVEGWVLRKEVCAGHATLGSNALHPRGDAAGQGHSVRTPGSANAFFCNEDAIQSTLCAMCPPRHAVTNSLWMRRCGSPGLHCCVNPRYDPAHAPRISMLHVTVYLVDAQETHAGSGIACGLAHAHKFPRCTPQIAAFVTITL